MGSAVEFEHGGWGNRFPILPVFDQATRSWRPAAGSAQCNTEIVAITEGARPKQNSHDSEAPFRLRSLVDPSSFPFFAPGVSMGRSISTMQPHPLPVGRYTDAMVTLSNTSLRYLCTIEDDCSLCPRGSCPPVGFRCPIALAKPEVSESAHYINCNFL